MNDYFAGWLASERQSDYLREVAKDERAHALHPEGKGGRHGRAAGLSAAVALLRRCPNPLARHGRAHGRWHWRTRPHGI